MSATRINQLHLSLIQTFQFCKQNSEYKRKFNFFDDEDKYFKTVVKEDKRLGNEEKKIGGLGKLRSVLDVPESKRNISPDSFFYTLQRFYLSFLNQKMDEKLIFPPHYPCCIDISPSDASRYEIVDSSLPASFQGAKAAMSFSMRIYPARIASLRLACFFKTENSFKVEDIIDFLLKKETHVKSDGKEISIYSLCQELTHKTTEGLLKKPKPVPSVMDVYSIIDIVRAQGLQLCDQSKKEVFWPLLNLQKNVTTEEDVGENLSDRNDVILPGKKSIVTYLPGSNSICDRRKVRRWLRNFIELYSIQKFLATEIDSIMASQEYKMFSSNWITDFGRLFKSKAITRLFSLWLYTTIHLRAGTFRKELWKERYQKSLKILDQENKIQISHDTVLNQLSVLKKEARETESRVGDRIVKLVDVITKGLDSASKYIPSK